MKRTALNKKHVELRGKLVDFHGWEMPLHYEPGIIKEHLNVRASVGIFDVSHMGDFIITDKKSGKGLQSLLTNNVEAVPIGKCVYTHLPDTGARIIDDLIVTKMGDGKYFCVPNASMIDTDRNWMINNADVDITDVSDDLSCIAVQGPKARTLVVRLFGEQINTIGKFEAMAFDYETRKRVDFDVLTKESIIDKGIGMISGTGYTGEDGVELIVPNSLAPSVWDELLSLGKDLNVLPIGLGARDSLRLEAGFLLSGQDFNRNRTTIETNCAWVIKWDHDFMGKEVLRKMKEEGKHEKMIGIMLEGKAPARAGSKVKLSEFPHEIVGSVSSGNYAPSLGRAIALAYIKREYAKPGINLILDYNGRELKGVTTKTPFINKA